MAKKKNAEFLKWFGPLLDALRALGDSGRPRDGVKLVEMFERVELGVNRRVVYDVDPSYFEKFRA